MLQIVVFVTSYFLIGITVALTAWKLGKIKSTHEDIGSTMLFWPLFAGLAIIVAILYVPVTLFDKLVKHLQNLDRSS